MKNTMSDVSIAKLIFFVFLIYGVLPTALIRFTGIGAVTRAPAGRRLVAITFDDGPDPRYTPRVLDVLEKHQIKACFFLVGKKALEHPEIVRRIAAAGHEIGVHGYSHKPAWVLGPRATAREIDRAISAVEGVTGQKPLYFRPAWGLFNLFSPIYCRKRGVKFVLWTYMSWDWTKKATPESIIKRTLRRLTDGAILVFHDSDTTPGAAAGSPDKMVAALSVIIEALKSKGMSAVPLKETGICKTK